MLTSTEERVVLQFARSTKGWNWEHDESRGRMLNVQLDGVGELSCKSRNLSNEYE